MQTSLHVCCGAASLFLQADAANLLLDFVKVECQTFKSLSGQNDQFDQLFLLFA